MRIYGNDDYFPVSIRSPHRSEGRHLGTDKLYQILGSFNPLPSPKRGETYIGFIHFNGSAGFNPLPSPKRGETLQGSPFPRNKKSFNPLPSPKRGETSGRAVRRQRYGCFNPLPSPKRGETIFFDYIGGIVIRFNPLPSPKRGETTFDRAHGLTTQVSIRSPHRSEGRPYQSKKLHTLC